MNIWTLGDAVVDLLPLANMQYEACAGGAPVNVAVGSALLGQRSGFIGRVGEDTFGRFLYQTMQTAGVNTQHIEFDRHRHTSTVLVSLDQQGERHFDFLVNPSADQFLSAASLPDFGPDILHFCSLALVSSDCRQTLEQAMEKIGAAGGTLSFDLNLRKQMWHDEADMFATIQRLVERVDILKMSEEELYWLTQSDDINQARQRLAKYPARLKIVTYGAQGAMVFWCGQAIFFTGYNVESIDTTGAGDAFMAGLLAALPEDGWPEQMSALCSLIGQASGCGALATMQKGALTSLPDKDALLNFIHSQPPLEIEIKEAPLHHMD